VSGADDLSTTGTPDLLARRRLRSVTYLRMWGVDVDVPPSALAVMGETDVLGPSVEAVRGRALATGLVALRGQGLSLTECFAFADAYEVWDHLSHDEHDFVLTEEPTGEALLQYAWRYERCQIHLWALQLVRHLPFSDTQVDSASLLETLITKLATAEPSTLSMRTPKELLDGADVAWCAGLVVRSNPGITAMHPSVVHERAVAFDELLGRA
jgi:hypothetical protein